MSDESWRETLKALAQEDEREDRIQNLIENITVAANEDDEVEDILFASKKRIIPNAERDIVANVVMTNVTVVAKPDEDEVLAHFHRPEESGNEDSDEEEDDFASAGWANPNKANAMTAKARAQAAAAARNAQLQAAAYEAAREAAEAEAEALRRETEARIRSGSTNGHPSQQFQTQSQHQQYQQHHYQQNQQHVSSQPQKQPNKVQRQHPGSGGTTNLTTPSSPQSSQPGFFDKLKSVFSSLPSMTGEVVVEVKTSESATSQTPAIPLPAGISAPSGKATVALAQAFALSGSSSIARMQRTRPPEVVELLSTTFAYLDSAKEGKVHKKHVRNFFNLVCVRTIAEIRAARASGKDLAKDWDPEVWEAACSDILEAIDVYDEETISLELWNVIFSELSLDSETLQRVLAHSMVFVQQ